MKPHNDTQAHLSDDNSNQEIEINKRIFLTGYFLFMFVMCLSIYLMMMSNATKADDSAVKTTIVNMAHGGYDDATTKLLAVMPSRHTLAFFVPSHGTTTPSDTIGTKPDSPAYGGHGHIFNTASSVASYDGLIEPNTKPFTGNTFSRLVTVVETRHPMTYRVAHLTKLLGGHTHA